MSSTRKMATLAVVALGLVALAAPAGASANKRTNEDIKRLGSNVNELRKKTDEMNRTISSLASVAGSSLTQLKDGLTALADTTANFKYGVVQISAATGGPGDGIVGLGPSTFYVTPPIMPTGAQSTVSFALPDTTNLGGPRIKLLAAVRSLKPDTGSVECRVTIYGPSGGAGQTGIRSTSADGAGGFFKKMPQSRITPENGNTSFPLALVATEDNVIDLADRSVLSGGTTFTPAAVTPATMSCLRTS